jgi:uncharacterized protein YdeI (YjbR/CyaY-like superfamily)
VWRLIAHVVGRRINTMPEPDPKKALAFASPAALRAWLDANHDIESELWIKVFKKGSGVPSVTWDDVVAETLCWGWIDGLRKPLDGEAYLQRITPRKGRSTWSKRNTEHVERLIAEGRMREPGLAQVRAAQADGRWDAAYLPPSEAEVPADFVAALDGRPGAKRFFEALPRSSRYTIAYGLTTAKKAETRRRRFERFMDLLEREERPGPNAAPAS